MTGPEKLSKMRSLMESRGYDAYIIPHGDQHDNEYIAEADERIKFISNFSGSNGIGLVTKDIALMWTDGRYYIQIEKELYPGWSMKKMGRDEETLTQYILKNIPKNTKIAFDFGLFTIQSAENLQRRLKDYKLIDDENNLIDEIWATNKPKYSENKTLILPVEFTGASVNDKYKILDEKIKIELVNDTSLTKAGKYRLLISRLDDIAWLLNLRGNDIPFNPVFFSYALFYSTPEGLNTHLFINKSKVDTEEIKKYCTENKITIFGYDEILKELNNSDNDLLTLLDNESTNFKMYSIIKKNKNGLFKELGYDLIEDLKSVKNSVEIAGYRKANIKDCTALIKFFAWMEQELLVKNRTDLNEYEIGKQATKFREEQENFMGESFASICACGSNAAIIHYEQNENLHSDMNKNILILCDTGGQYKDGTTDITRTVHYGNASEREKEMYTRVLLGNLSLERLIFRKGKTLEQIDCVPRQFLYMVGEDYLHGTSHGVGHFLNVHEGPYGKPLKVGNVITNEPGYYEKDNFGIRIENEVLVCEYDEKHYKFENLTFLPYERNLIDMDLISNEFKKYIDDFHKKVYEVLSPFLKEDEKALDYLRRKTEPL